MRPAQPARRPTAIRNSRDLFPKSSMSLRDRKDANALAGRARLFPPPGRRMRRRQNCDRLPGRRQMRRGAGCAPSPRAGTQCQASQCNVGRERRADPGATSTSCAPGRSRPENVTVPLVGASRTPVTTPADRPPRSTHSHPPNAPSLKNPSSSELSELVDIHRVGIPPKEPVTRRNQLLGLDDPDDRVVACIEDRHQPFHSPHVLAVIARSLLSETLVAKDVYVSRGESSFSS